MKWRPEGWKNQYCVQGGGITCEIDVFEAGADAMLKALRELTHEEVELDSTHIEKGDCTGGTYPDGGFPYSVTQVFIPDDVEKSQSLHRPSPSTP